MPVSWQSGESKKRLYYNRDATDERPTLLRAVRNFNTLANTKGRAESIRNEGALEACAEISNLAKTLYSYSETHNN